MSEKIIVNRERYENLEDHYKNRRKFEMLIASYVRDLLYTSVIKPKEEGDNIPEIKIRQELAMEFLELFSSKLFTEEEMDTAKRRWEEEVGTISEHLPEKPKLRLYIPD